MFPTMQMRSTTDHLHSEISFSCTCM